LAIIEGTTAFVAAALKDLRNDPKWKHRPIFTVHAVGTDCLVDCMAVLEKGADASLCTPLTSRQLIARIRAVLRREATVLSHARSYSFGDLQIDLDRHEVTVKGRPVALTLREFQVLEQLAKGPDRVHTRDELLTLVWGANVALEEHNLDVHIHSLRRKLETNPERPRYIVTVRGVGYRLKVS
jgi:DNA-binding response OmpR family regulator